jgi:hypothetical protein
VPVTRFQKYCHPTAEAVMVSKCANPACLAPFRYLHEGRIFTVRTTTAEHRPDGADPKVERYWLCSTCADSMTLVLQNGRVSLRSLAAIPQAGPKPVRSVARTTRCVA